MRKTEKPVAALIFGGRGYEHDVSVRGAKYVISLIDRDEYTPLPVYISRSGNWLIPNDAEVSDIELISSGKTPLLKAYPAFFGENSGLIVNGELIPVSVAFPLLHGDYGEDGIISGTLENAKIPYVGCDTVTGALLSDKIYTKILAESIGIPTVPWVSSRVKSPADACALAEARLNYPLFIKPARLGSSVGASPVASKEDFFDAYKRAYELGNGRVLIEEQIDIFFELEIAYYAVKGKELFTEAGEISCENRFYDYDSKYSDGSKAHVSAESHIDEKTENTIIEYAREIAGLTGLRDLGRIDFFLSADGKIYFNEINTMPGFTEGSLYPSLLKRSGIAPNELISSLLEEARERA